MAIIRISAEGNICIPEDLLTKLGAKPGQEMMMSEREGGIILTPLPSDPVAFLTGVLAGGQSLQKELVAERTEEVESD